MTATRATRSSCRGNRRAWPSWPAVGECGGCEGVTGPTQQSPHRFRTHRLPSRTQPPRASFSTFALAACLCHRSSSALFRALCFFVSHSAFFFSFFSVLSLSLFLSLPLPLARSLAVFPLFYPALVQRACFEGEPSERLYSFVYLSTRVLTPDPNRSVSIRGDSHPSVAAFVRHPVTHPSSSSSWPPACRVSRAPSVPLQGSSPRPPTVALPLSFASMFVHRHSPFRIAHSSIPTTLPPPYSTRPFSFPSLSPRGHGPPFACTVSGGLAFIRSLHGGSGLGHHRARKQHTYSVSHVSLSSTTARELPNCNCKRARIAAQRVPVHTVTYMYTVRRRSPIANYCIPNSLAKKKNPEAAADHERVRVAPGAPAFFFF